jgi:hypothetical protein
VSRSGWHWSRSMIHWCSVWMKWSNRMGWYCSRCRIISNRILKYKTVHRSNNRLVGCGSIVIMNCFNNISHYRIIMLNCRVVLWLIMIWIRMSVSAWWIRNIQD